VPNEVEKVDIIAKREADDTYPADPRPWTVDVRLSVER
jgi:hypothetical protein